MAIEVGKTSLVHQTLRALDNPRVIIGCNEHVSFQSFARELLKQIGLDPYETETGREIEKNINGQMKPFGVGVNTGAKQKNATKRDGLGKVKFDPWAIFEHIRVTNKNFIVVIDEYDAVPRSKKEFHSGIAYLMKHLADNAHDCNTRIIVVGIAQTAGELLGEHESIERSAREIYLRPLRREDIIDFLAETEHELGFKFSDSVKNAIAWCSNGYPYFVHLVGLECIDVMLSRDPQCRFVADEHYRIAIKNSVSRAFRSILRKYNEAIEGITLHQKALIYQLAIHKDNELDRKELQRILAKKEKMDEKTFDHAWVPLAQEKRLIYVSRNQDKIRFSDPLMKPFLRGLFISPHRPTYKGLKQGRLFED